MTVLTGTLRARGRRTVAAALRASGNAQARDWSLVHQVLTRARWSPLAVSRQLLVRIVETVVPAGACVDLVIDDTLERRWGSTIRTRGQDRDRARSSTTRSVRSPGVRWIVMAVVITVPWTRAALGVTVSVRAGDHARRQRARGHATHDHRDVGAADGQPGPTVASRR
jgi:hypothetical protein